MKRLRCQCATRMTQHYVENEKLFASDICSVCTKNTGNDPSTACTRRCHGQKTLFDTAFGGNDGRGSATYLILCS